MKRIKFIIKTKSKSYPFFIGHKILNQTGSILKKNLPNVKKIAIITDNKIPKKIVSQLKNSLKNYKVNVFFLNSGEKSKNIKSIFTLVNSLLKLKFNRSDCLIALGGGVVGDASGLTANLVKRGIKFVNIPTTLLAQVDASIGGKTAVNSNYGKNLIGTFYQPDLIISDTKVLEYLSKKNMVCGYAEILKHSIIQDRSFFFWLDKNGKEILEYRKNNFLKKAILQSCKIKSRIVELDEKEKNLRMILNFGHTFAHAFESANNYSKNLNHGEAVILGISTAIKFAYSKKIMSLNELKLIQNHIQKLKLPHDIKKYFKKNQIKKIIEFMKSDKKNISNKINLILIKKIGKKPAVLGFKANEIKDFLIKKFN